jgi:uncharacterized protein (DUF2336 family)
VQVRTLADLPFVAALRLSRDSRDLALWLRIASDVFVAEPSADDRAVAVFEREMVPLLQAADDQTRLDVARRLARGPSMPPALLGLFALFGGEAYRAILRRASNLTDATLLNACESSDAAAVAVASRPGIDRMLVDWLSHRHDIEILDALVRNLEAPLDSAALERIVRRAVECKALTGDSRLAASLLARAPLGVEHAQLFFCANSQQRLEILAAAQRLALGRPVQSAIEDEARNALDELETYAIARRPEQFVARLARALSCSEELALQIVEDSSGEALVVALSALGAPKEKLVRILASNDLLFGDSFGRISALARLKDALHPVAARQIIRAIGAAEARPDSRVRYVRAPDAGSAQTRGRPSRPAGKQAAGVSPRVIRGGQEAS